MATMAGRSRGLGHRIRWVVGLSAVTCGAACSESNPMMQGSTTEAFDQAGMLESFAHNVVQPAHADFLATVQTLVPAVQAWQSRPDAASLDAARAAWRQSMRAWSRAEMMQIGPGAPSAAPGGESIRDEIYSWPTISACSVDQQLVSQRYLDPRVHRRQTRQRLRAGCA